MTLKQIQTIESLMALRDLKVGDVVTERQMKAIETLLGPTLEIARNMPLKMIQIDFKNGEAVVSKNELGVEVEVKTT